MSSLVPNPHRFLTSAPPAPPAGFQTVTEGSAVALFQQGRVFYNRVQVLNRDLSVLAIRVHDERRVAAAAASPRDSRRAWAARAGAHAALTAPPPPAPLPPLRVLEALSASGLRSMRYARELPRERLGLIVANDLEPAAVDAIRRNVAFNAIEPGLVVPNAGDASLVMHLASRGLALPGTMQDWMVPSASRAAASSAADASAAAALASAAPAPTPASPVAAAPANAAAPAPAPFLFDVVDLDPYGTAAPFLDAAVQAVGEGGLLCVTCTDMAVLAGNHMDVCHAKYGSVPVKARHFGEQALRIVLACVESHANRHKRSVRPLLAVAVDFYVRVFVSVHADARASNEAPARLANVHQCSGCDAFWLWPLAKGGGRGRGLWWPGRDGGGGDAAPASVAPVAAAAAEQEEAAAQADDGGAGGGAGAEAAGSEAGADAGAEAAAGADAATSAAQPFRRASKKDRRDRAEADRQGRRAGVTGAGAGTGAGAVGCAGGGASSAKSGGPVTANSAPDLPSSCPHCGRPIVVGGPLWLDAIHDPAFAARMLALGEACFGRDGLGPARGSAAEADAGAAARFYQLRAEGGGEGQDQGEGACEGAGVDDGGGEGVGRAPRAALVSWSSTSSASSASPPAAAALPRAAHDGGSNDVQTVSASRRRLLGVLRSIAEDECAPGAPAAPLYYELASLSKRLRTTAIPLAHMQSALLNAGYAAAGSHCAPNVVKTDAQPGVVWDVMRQWARENGRATGADAAAAQQPSSSSAASAVAAGTSAASAHVAEADAEAEAEPWGEGPAPASASAHSPSSSAASGRAPPPFSACSPLLRRLQACASVAEALLSVDRESSAAVLCPRALPTLRPRVPAPAGGGGGAAGAAALAAQVAAAAAAQAASPWWVRPAALLERQRVRRTLQAAGAGQRFMPNPQGRWGPMARAHGNEAEIGAAADDEPPSKRTR